MFQVSYIVEDAGGASHLVQHDFLGEADEVASLREVLREILGTSVRDLQVYEPVLDRRSSAAAAVHDILNAAGELRGARQNLLAIAHLKGFAGRLDELCGQPGVKTEPWMVDFVWDNGGAEDNAYGATFRAPADEERLRQDFQRAFAAALNDIAYDVQVGLAPAPGQIHENLQSMGGELASTLESFGLEAEAEQVVARFAPPSFQP